MFIYNSETKAIKLIAKDTGGLTISLENYILDEGDTVFFTVNDRLEKEEPLIQKVITEFQDGKAVVSLTTNDTNLPPGDYYYDIEVDTADGRVDTVIGPAKFKVLGGVKY